MPQTLPQESEFILKRLVESGVVDPDIAWTPMPGGTINTIWRTTLVDGEPVVIRIGPPVDVVERGPSWMRSGALACEAIVLDRLRPCLSCLPVPVAAGFLHREQPWLLQRLVPGEPFSEVMGTMRPEDRAAIWRQLGEVVRRVHRVDAPWFGTPDGYLIHLAWADMVMTDAKGLLDDAIRYGLEPAPFEQLVAEVELNAGILREVQKPAIVHSDLDPRHVFVRRGASGGWEICGLIDWEYARFVDPLSESIVVELLARPVDDPDRVAFLEGYGHEGLDLSDAGFRQRQAIYRRIADGWVLTDAARLATQNLEEVKRRKVQ